MIYGQGETQRGCRFYKPHPIIQGSWQKKALWTGTLTSKLIPQLIVDDMMDMLSKDVTMVFRKHNKGEGKKLYSDYAPEETITISNEDEDVW